jgi:transmembrane sensor
MESTMTDQTADEAGYWDTRLRSPTCTEEDRARFASWRDAKPENRLAFESAQAIVKTLREHASRADIRAIRDAAKHRPRTSGLRLQWVAAALVVTVIGVAGWAIESKKSIVELGATAARIAEYATAQTYETGTAQRSIVTLRDGSTVELNAKTRIRVAFNTERRKVELLHGQALFNVARNPQRPFIVRAADRDIVAVGTAFDVRLDATTVRVTLIEGKVNVIPVQASSPENQASVLTPGQQLVAAVQQIQASGPGTQALVRSTDTAKVTGWREGRVFMEDLTLADAVTEMNRYSQVQIRIDTHELAGLRINGMFRAGEQQAFIHALESYLPIAARYEGDTQIVLVRRQQ